MYKGYTIEQFENPNKFKDGTQYDNLSQVFTQDQVVNVIPFWGNTEEGNEIGITRADMSIAFKFEPTCVFIGSVVSDNASNGISRKCIPTNTMGAMDEMVTGEGTIEMIRKTPGGAVEEFQIKGTQLINENGVWCYQIPMNLDFMMTDEYGNMVPTDNPDKGIPTRTRVRFRVSMQDNELNTDNYFRCKVLVPNRSGLNESGGPDYDFGTNTREDSFRDLYWNYVYSVKSYIPRFQKTSQVKTERFTGIKHCNIYGNNNPMPYNNIRIKIPFMFTLLCALIKTYVRIVYFVNSFFKYLNKILAILTSSGLSGEKTDIKLGNLGFSLKYVTIGDNLCPEMEGWYFAPGGESYPQKYIYGTNMLSGDKYWNIDPLDNTFLFLSESKMVEIDVNGNLSERAVDEEDFHDKESIDTQNSFDNKICLTSDMTYLLSCIEMNLAQEYRVINFDFYNDWLNGVIYIPRFMRYIRTKKTYLFGAIRIKERVRGCMSDTSIFSSTRKYYQQCALKYSVTKNSVNIITPEGCTQDRSNRRSNKDKDKKGKMKCHGRSGGAYVKIFGNQGGIVKDKKTIAGQSVYYMKPYDIDKEGNNSSNYYLFATDIILLGSLNDCDSRGVPQFFRYLSNSTYTMPTNLALTTMNDEAYIYATRSSTMCTNNKNYKYSGVRQAELTYSAETYATKNSEDPIVSETGDDAVPVTEAAGISWNYTGPDQVYDTQDDLYTPGGHFIGLSCTASQTTIKSCVNLQRICEFGSTMSMRKEIVNKVSDGELSYSYIVPNGIISTDEVISVDPRAMFATMNSNILLSNSMFNEVGYPIYSFNYLRPDTFDGSLQNKVNTSTFNREVDTSALTNSYGYGNEDYDASAKSYMRSLEFKSDDYLKFRFGVNNINEIGGRFIKEGNQLPQYENSFYFFFGLRNGSTALDEFNKQFFSECEGNKLQREPGINIDASFSFDSGGSIDITLTNFGLSDSIFEYEITGESGTTSVTSSSTEYSIDSLSPGVYRITVTDSVHGGIITGEAYVGINLVSMNIVPVELMTTDTGITTPAIYSGRTGGYILVDDIVTVEGNIYKLSNATTHNNNEIWLNGDSGYKIVLDGIVGLNQSGYIIFTDENGDTKHMLFVDLSGKTMDVSLKYKVNGQDRLFSVYSHTFTDNSTLIIDFGDGLMYGYSDSNMNTGLNFNNWTKIITS